MPDPSEYLNAVLATFFVSTAILLTLRILSRNCGRVCSESASVAAITCGLLAGYSTLKFSWPWPPDNALDRFFTIVLPALLIIEFITAIVGDVQPTDTTTGPANHHHQRRFYRAVRSLLWIARFSLCCSTGRILMHDSIYLDASNSSGRDAWWIQNMPGILLISAMLLMTVWCVLIRLARRTVSGSIELCLSLCLICAGCTTMMAGYIKGGSAALPLATVMMVSALASRFLTRKRLDSQEAPVRYSAGTAVIGVGLVSLFSLLWIGRFFGQLTSVDAVVIFFGPVAQLDHGTAVDSQPIGRG
jgi:hypothetical protein